MTDSLSTTTTDDIIETLSFFDSWEDRYKYIIELGKELPHLAEEYKVDGNIIRGCQSQVWLVSKIKGDTLFFMADSDAFIVKGLLAVVLAAYNGKTSDAILAFDVEAYFETLNLLQHLSLSRGNGLRAMVQRIKLMADQS